MRTLRTASFQHEINVTPLVDVCLVMLIIFMVVTPLMNGIPVKLPSAKSAAEIEHEPLQITLNADHTLYVGSAVVRSEQLTDELVRQRSTTDRPVVVRAEKTLPYGDVVQVLDACRRAGFTDVGLAAQKRD